MLGSAKRAIRISSSEGIDEGKMSMGEEADISKRERVCSLLKLWLALDARYWALANMN
jgi:hypothetical protein